MFQSVARQVFARARKTGLTWRLAVLGSLAWALAMGCAAFVGGLWFGWAPGTPLLLIVWAYARGAVLAFAPALFVTRFVFLGQSHWRAVVLVLVLAGLTLGLTAGLIALEYRDYFSQWHAPFASRIWMWQQFYTFAGSAYQFAVVGLRLYWPLGPVLLIGFSLWANRLAH